MVISLFSGIYDSFDLRIQDALLPVARFSVQALFYKNISISNLVERLIYVLFHKIFKFFMLSGHVELMDPLKGLICYFWAFLVKLLMILLGKDYLLRVI
jgi:hypothetical protein